jgi:hypothetical protein
VIIAGVIPAFMRDCAIASAMLALILADKAIGTETTPPAVASSCTALRNDRERLACYDRAMSYRSDSQNNELAVPENVFGANGQMTRPNTAGPAPREEIASITARVKTLRKSAEGALVIELDNGQVWLQTQGSELLLSANDPVTITRAAMSSFRISTPSQRTARVKRVQ